MSIPNLQLLKDWHLAIIVLIFVMVDLIILTTVTAIEDVHYTAKTIHDAENPTIVNVSVILVDTLCIHVLVVVVLSTHVI